jgi:hypothetical protein
MSLLAVAALYAVAATGAGDTDTLTVYLNGECAQEAEGVHVTLSAAQQAGPWDAVVEAARVALAAARSETDLEQPCDMAGSNGLPLPSAAAALAVRAGGVWLVPRHRRWIWPVGKLREVIPLPDVSTALDGKAVALESISASPRVFHVHNFVSDEEMNAVRASTLAIKDKYGKLQPSTVGAGAEMRLDPTRTSDSAFVPGSAEAMTIKRRAFELLRIAPYDDMQVGGLQVLRYRAAQAYRNHHDYFPPDTSGSGDEGFSFDSRNGGSNRMATVLVFLSDVDVGGALTFPNARPPTSDIGSETQRTREAAAMQALAANGTLTRNSWQWEMGEACRTGFSVRPKRGNAVLFYSQVTVTHDLRLPARRTAGLPMRLMLALLTFSNHACRLLSFFFPLVRSSLASLFLLLLAAQGPGGNLDPRSLHGACPVLSNVTEKWAANVWVWNKRRVHHDPTRSKMHGGDGKTGAKPGKAAGREDVRFVNKLGSTVSLYWQLAGQGGEPTFWAEVLPGSSAQSSTWVGHKWLAKRGKEFGNNPFVWEHTIEEGDSGDLAIPDQGKDEL